MNPVSTRPAPAGYTPGEELANGITHGVAALLTCAGAAVLITLAALTGNAWHIVSFSVFSGALILLFVFSTLYHSFQSPRVKYVFEVLDHSAIFLVIAGTYTPLTLVTLHGVLGWTLFGVVWGLAAAGIVMKAFFTGRFRLVSTLLYLGMGWMILAAGKPLVASLPSGGLTLLIAGGVFYSLGTIFYLWKKLPYHHAVWHLFVFAGALCHYFTLLFYVLPQKV
jgi:hemolysin III